MLCFLKRVIIDSLSRCSIYELLAITDEPLALQLMHNYGAILLNLITVSCYLIMAAKLFCDRAQCVLYFFIIFYGTFSIQYPVRIVQIPGLDYGHTNWRMDSYDEHHANFKRIFESGRKGCADLFGRLFQLDLHRH